MLRAPATRERQYRRNYQVARRMRLLLRNHVRTLHPSLPFAAIAPAWLQSCRDEQAISAVRRGRRKSRPARGDQIRRRELRVRLRLSDCLLSWLTRPSTNPTDLPTVEGGLLFPWGRRPQTPGP